MTQLKFDPILGRQLSQADLVTLEPMAQTALTLYYDQITATLQSPPYDHFLNSSNCGPLPQYHD